MTTWQVPVPFILIATFTMLNLFIGIIVDTMQTVHEEPHAVERSLHRDTRQIELELRALRDEIRDLRQALSPPSDGG